MVLLHSWSYQANGVRFERKPTFSDSSCSLTLNIYGSVHKPSLLSPSEHSRPLFTDAQLVDTASARCSHCREPLSYVELREFRHVMLAER